jgi:hypothetical protein
MDPESMALNSRQIAANRVRAADCVEVEKIFEPIRRDFPH